MRRTSLIVAALLLGACDRHPPAPAQTPPPVTAENKHGDGMADHMVITAQNDEFLYQEQIYPAIMATVKSGQLAGDDRAQVSKMNRDALAELRQARSAAKAKQHEAWAVHHGLFYRKCGEMVAILTKVTGKKNAR